MWHDIQIIGMFTGAQSSYEASSACDMLSPSSGEAGWVVLDSTDDHRRPTMSESCPHRKSDKIR